VTIQAPFLLSQWDRADVQFSAFADHLEATKALENCPGGHIGHALKRTYSHPFVLAGVLKFIWCLVGPRRTALSFVYGSRRLFVKTTTSDSRRNAPLCGTTRGLIFSELMRIPDPCAVIPQFQFAGPMLLEALLDNLETVRSSPTDRPSHSRRCCLFFFLNV
jgi:hypothetical protein